MHIVHPRGRSRTQRERTYRRLSVALTLGMAAALPWISDLLWFVGVVGGALVIGHRLDRRFRGLRRGQAAEEVLGELLHDLPAGYYLLTDVAVGRRRCVDHVLVGPCGVLVIEPKHTTGHVRCERGRWYVDGRRRRSLGRRVNRATARLKERLRALDSNPAKPTLLRYVESMLVFTDPECRLQARRPRTMAVLASDLVRVIQALSAHHRMSPFLAHRVAWNLRVAPPRKATQEAPPLQPALSA